MNITITRIAAAQAPQLHLTFSNFCKLSVADALELLDNDTSFILGRSGKSNADVFFANYRTFQAIVKLTVVYNCQCNEDRDGCDGLDGCCGGHIKITATRYTDDGLTVVDRKTLFA